ncbi:hypothetical protein BH11ACT8_BH11ACT8_00010 [soil metagenome]
MTSMTRGPLTPAVYWRRRLFVLGIVSALVLIAVNLAMGNDGTQDSRGARATQVAGTPAAPATDESTGTPIGPEKGPEKGAKNKKNKKNKGSGKAPTAGPTYSPDAIVEPPPPPVLADPVGSCADDDISVAPSVTGAIAGRAVTITLTLRTLTTPACTWRIAPNHLALKITQGSDEVWASRECSRKLPKASVVVRQAQVSTYDLTWNSRRSESGCPVLTDFAEPGDYTVTAASYCGEPADADFTLGEPPAVVPEKPATPAKPAKPAQPVETQKPGAGKPPARR